MSPEQAKGKRIDKRTDIFAFGAVLFEMLTGKKAFAGEDVSEVLAAVIKLEPDWDMLSAGVPPLLRKLLRRCLEKDSKQWLHDIADARLELEETLAGADSEPPLAQQAPKRATAAALGHRACDNRHYRGHRGVDSEAFPRMARSWFTKTGRVKFASFISARWGKRTRRP